MCLTHAIADLDGAAPLTAATAMKVETSIMFAPPHPQRSESPSERSVAQAHDRMARTMGEIAIEFAGGSLCAPSGVLRRATRAVLPVRRNASSPTAWCVLSSGSGCKHRTVPSAPSAARRPAQAVLSPGRQIAMLFPAILAQHHDMRCITLDNTAHALYVM